MLRNGAVHFRTDPPVSQGQLKWADEIIQSRNQQRAKDSRTARDVVSPMHIIISRSPFTTPEWMPIILKPQNLPSPTVSYLVSIYNVQATPLKRDPNLHPSSKVCPPLCPADRRIANTTAKGKGDHLRGVNSNLRLDRHIIEA